MPTIEELIDQIVDAPERVDDSLVAELASRGAVVVTPVLNRAARVSGMKAMRLNAVLEALEDPEAADVLLEALERKDVKGLGMLVKAEKTLGRLGNRVAIPYLLEQLRAFYGFSLAATALADMDATEAIPAMTRKLHELLGHETAPDTVIAKARSLELDHVDGAAGLIRALAKLGDFSAAPYAIALSSRAWCKPSPRSMEEEGEIGHTYVMIAETIGACPGPGSQAALIRMTRDEHHEVRIEAIRTLLRLGTRTAIDHMVPRLGDVHEHVWGNAQARIAELTGCDPRELQQGEAHARRWWEAHRDGYRDDTLYLMGEPLDYARLLAMSKPVGGNYKFAEWFQLATGTFRGWPMHRFGYERFLRDVDAWWAEHGDRFRPGRLYRHGYELDVEAVCRPTT